MEIFLNIVWFCVSIALLALWVHALRRGESRLQWGTVVAFVLLLLLLFPVISMTDDLMAMNTLGEVEHILRRHDAPLQHLAPGVLFGGIVLCTLALLAMVLCKTASSRIRRSSFAARLLAGFVRASGVRPPPALRLAPIFS